MPQTRIKQLLAERGETQREFAGKVGITPGVLSQVANGRVRVWPALRTRVAAELGEDPFTSDTADGLVEQAVAQGLAAVVADPDVIRRVASFVRNAPEAS